MDKKVPKLQTPPLPPNQKFLDQNKAALRAVEVKLASKKKDFSKTKG